VLGAYREPYLFGHRLDLSLAAFREEEERETFNYDRAGVSLQTTRSLAPAWSLIARYTFARTRSAITQPPVEIDRQYRAADFSGPSLSVVYDTRDDPLDPRRGYFVGSDLQLSHAALGGKSFAKGFAQVSLYRRLAPRLLLALGSRLGAARTFRGQDLDAPDRFFAGGHYSMRAFDTDGVLHAGGQALVVSSAELRVRLSTPFSLAAFCDVGNVFPRVADLRLSALRYSAGLGLRYRTAVGPIRVDWGQHLDRRSGEPRGRLHITVGHAF
jgi:outer membrane protein insertion porin family